jgi:hypothetical protein
MRGLWNSGPEAIGLRGSRVERRPLRGLRSACGAGAPHRRLAPPDASSPAVPTAVSSFSYPLVIVGRNSSDRERRLAKGCLSHFLLMIVRLRPGDLPAQWRQRADFLHQYGGPWCPPKRRRSPITRCGRAGSGIAADHGPGSAPSPLFERTVTAGRYRGAPLGGAGRRASTGAPPQTRPHRRGRLAGPEIRL